MVILKSYFNLVWSQSSDLSPVISVQCGLSPMLSQSSMVSVMCGLSPVWSQSHVVSVEGSQYLVLRNELVCRVSECYFSLKGVVWAKMVKIIKFLFFAQKLSSGMGASHPKFLGG